MVKEDESQGQKERTNLIINKKRAPSLEGARFRHPTRGGGSCENLRLLLAVAPAHDSRQARAQEQHRAGFRHGSHVHFVIHQVVDLQTALGLEPRDLGNIQEVTGLIHHRRDIHEEPVRLIN